MHVGLFWLIFLTPDLEMYCQILDFHLNCKSRKKKTTNKGKTRRQAKTEDKQRQAKAPVSFLFRPSCVITSVVL